MRFARRAGLDEQVALAAQPQGHQVLMHRAGYEQGVRGQAPLHQIPIRQEQHELAVAHGVLGLRAQTRDCLPQPFRRVVLQVEELVCDFLEREDLSQLPL